MLICVRSVILLSPMNDCLLASADDTTEICNVFIHGKTHTSIINVYRPPIRQQNHFDPSVLTAGADTTIPGDLSAHHPLWDHGFDAADNVGKSW